MSTKHAQHTPGPWSLDNNSGDAGGLVILAESGDRVARVCWYGEQSETPQATKANARLIATAPELNAIASNFEITGPDADGLVWLVLHGNGTSGKAMFNLGSADRLAAQVALHFEADRRAAIAKATGSN